MKQKIILFAIILICFPGPGYSQTKPVVEKKKKATQKSAAKQTAALSKSNNDTHTNSDSLTRALQNIIRVMPNKHNENAALIVP